MTADSAHGTGLRDASVGTVGDGPPRSGVHVADSAGEMMSAELIRLHPDMTVEEALRRTQDAGGGEAIRYPYVVDDTGVLVGIVPLYRLVFGSRGDRIRDLMVTDVHRVSADTDREEAANVLRRLGLAALPVVDSGGRLLGTIPADDLLQALEEEASEDMYRMAGTTEEDPLHGPFRMMLRKRLPWLLVTLVGGLLICGVVRAFRVTVSGTIGLASFLPLIPLMGGTVAVRASTIVVRGIALERIAQGRAPRVVLRELAVAFVLGAICAVGVGIPALIGCADAALAGVVAMAVFSAVVSAALLGTVFPLAFRAAGIDPALAAGPVVTVFNDLVCVAVYLGLARSFLVVVR